MKNATLLSQVPLFDHLAGPLRRFNVRYVEQLPALLGQERGREALLRVLSEEDFSRRRLCWT